MLQALMAVKGVLYLEEHPRFLLAQVFHPTISFVTSSSHYLQPLLKQIRK